MALSLICAALAHCVEAQRAAIETARCMVVFVQNKRDVSRTPNVQSRKAGRMIAYSIAAVPRSLTSQDRNGTRAATQFNLVVDCAVIKAGNGRTAVGMID